MKRWALVLVMAAAMVAQTTVRTAATATSASAFKLGGTEVQVAGIPNWPVALGDEIQAGETPVTLKFQAGHRVTLAEGAKARIEADGKKTRLRLLTGSCSYLLASSLSLGFVVGNKPVVIRGAQGTLVVPTATVAGDDRVVAAEAVKKPSAPPPPAPVSQH
jgi:hypothetical protein